MITEDYVSFEVAKLLKEKGFAEPLVNYYYTAKGERVGYLMPEEQYLCPTHQMAMKWLREEKGVYIEIRRSINTFLFGAIIKKYNEDNFHQIPRNLNSYEQAVEAALKYVLENLLTFKIKEES